MGESLTERRRVGDEGPLGRKALSWGKKRLEVNSLQA